MNGLLNELHERQGTVPDESVDVRNPAHLAALGLTVA